MSKVHNIDIAAVKAESDRIAAASNGLFTRSEIAKRLVRTRIEAQEKELTRLYNLLALVKKNGI